jgi:PAS domain S-box-containing protein
MGESNALGAGVFLDLLFEDAHVGRCLVAPDGAVLRANRAWLRSTGLTLDRALCANVVDLFPEAREATLVMHARARAGQRVEVPRHVQRIEGRETWWEGTIDPVPMDGGAGLLLSTRAVSPGAESQEDEPALRKSEARFRTLAEESPVMLWARDAHGDPEFVNRAFRDFYGVTLEEVEGTDWWPPIHPEDAPMYGQRSLSAFRERKPFTAEMRVRRTDGEWRWVTVHGRPHFGEAGEYLGHVGVAVDITDRKRAEEALRLSEQKLRASVANAAIGFVLLTPEGRFLEANAAFLAIVNYSIEELRNMHPRQLVHPDDFAENDRQIRRMLAGEFSDFVTENRYLRKGGEVVWVRKSSSVVRDAHGEPAWAVSLVEDITQRKRAEEMLRGTLHRFYSVLSGIYSPVVLVGPDERVEFVNEAFCELFRLKESPEDLVGLGTSDIAEKMKDVYLHPDEANARVMETIRLRQPVKGEEVALRDGRTFLRDFVPLYFNGEARGRLWLNYDITDRKRAEEALREEDRRKAEFLAVLSHELRNPLAPIRNSIFLLEQSAPGSKQAIHALGVIRRQTEHVTRLIDDLLDVTRISRGKIVLKRTRVDLREIVRRTADDLRSLFAQAGVDLHVDDASGPVWITADPMRITQVLGNLLQNAVKFTPAGGSATVTLAAKGDQAELRLRDTGVGMEPGAIERMFTPFVQAETTLARTKGGLGLGLALVKGLVEMHGGTVEAHSEGLGRGAEFVVRLTMMEIEEKTGRERHEVAGARPRTVLVIEDNMDAGETLAEILEFQGHHARVARDGKSGLKLARELHPEVVLCDIGLPDIDGYEVAREIRSDEALRGTRLVAVSGYAQPEDQQRSREAGFDAHVAKPPDIDELSKLLV